MRSNVGLNNILNYLESERERFEKAGKSGMFCDCKTCLNNAEIIKWTIRDMKDSIDLFDDYIVTEYFR